MLTEEQKKRLAALHIKDAAALTEQEQKELAALTTMAEVDGLSIDDAFMAQYGPTEDRPLTGDELKKHISDAVTEGLKHYSGNMDVSKLAEEITKSLNIPDTGKGIAPEDLKSAVASALSAEAIIESLQSKLPTVPGEDQIKKLVEEVVNANLRNQSKNFYPVDEDINVPLSGHKGNLSVAEYQLLNICKMTGKVIDAKNVPTDINDGIPESVRKSAEQAGAKFVQSLRMGRKDVFTTGDGHIFPSDLSSTLLYRLYLESQLAAALISQEIPMPTDPYTLPIATTRIKYRKGSEAPATTTADKIGLSDVTLKTAKLIGITDFPTKQPKIPSFRCFPCSWTTWPKVRWNPWKTPSSMATRRQPTRTRTSRQPTMPPSCLTDSASSLWRRLPARLTWQPAASPPRPSSK